MMMMMMEVVMMMSILMAMKKSGHVANDDVDVLAIGGGNICKTPPTVSRHTS